MGREWRERERDKTYNHTRHRVIKDRTSASRRLRSVLHSSTACREDISVGSISERRWKMSMWEGISRSFSVGGKESEGADMSSERKVSKDVLFFFFFFFRTSDDACERVRTNGGQQRRLSGAVGANQAC